MKNIQLLLATALLLVLNACSNNKHEENKDMPPADTASTAAATVPAATEAEPDSATMAKAWEAYMKPGDMHKWMASTDGKWDAELTFWMAPGAPPAPTEKAKAKNEMVLGGRYQETEYKGKMMGMDFEGHGTLAYDNATKEFISTWIDNMGTGIMVTKGKYDPTAKELRMTGTMVNAATGKEEPIRQVTKIIDDKHQVMEMYCTKKGQEFKNMEIKLSKS
jgi:hypothetical protein